MQSLNLNAYQTVVEILINEGYVIVQLMVGGCDVMYFAANEFHPPIRGNSENVPFGRVIGVNITEFMKVNGGLNEQRQILGRFKETMNNQAVIRMEFDENTNWYKWASV